MPDDSHSSGDTGREGARVVGRRRGSRRFQEHRDPYPTVPRGRPFPRALSVETEGSDPGPGPGQCETHTRVPPQPTCGPRALPSYGPGPTGSDPSE